MSPNRAAHQLLLVAVLSTATGTPMNTFAQDKSKTWHTPLSIFESSAKGELSSLNRATEWLTSQPLTAGSLTGKVVLIDIWTYTCINWIRTRLG